MKLKKQVTVCGAAVFCVAVFSLYLMLDHVQRDPARLPPRRHLPRNQISALQSRIEQLEQLLEENHEIIGRIKDSVLELTVGHEGRSAPLPLRLPNGSWALPADGRPGFFSVAPGDCRLGPRAARPEPDLQMLAVSALLPYDNQDGGAWKQGFDITYQPHEWDAQPLQVFVVPHSHNDPGWIKTFDKYYVDQTQHILNNMVLKLQEDPRRRFIWSEISFFSKWWDNISSEKRTAVRRLIGNGQLEMATGGWVMPDEANSHYFAMIDQLIEGHQWLEKNIDPDSSTDLLCHMMPFYSYDVPHTCGPDPKICCQFDFKRLPGGRINCPWKVPPKAITSSNVAERAQLLLDQYRKKSKLFRSSVLMVPLGDDFRYDKPQEWDAQFLNYQRLFDFLNARPELHVQAQFGTLSDYFDALYKQMGIVPGMRPPGFPVLSGDFFSYADREDHYWTGYYTSRPFYKSMGRVLEAHLRAAETLYSLALSHARHAGMESRYPLSDYAMLTDARRNLGLFQHHDAITGTAKEAVVVDYGVRLLHSLMNAKKIIINAAHYLVLADKEAYHYDMAMPFLGTDETRLNQDSLPEKMVIKLDATPRFVVVFNPLEQERLTVVSLLVNTPWICVLNEEGQPLAVQLSAQWQSATDMVPDVFQVSVMIRLPALGLTILQLIKSFDSHNTLKSSVRLFLHGHDFAGYKHEAVPVQVLSTATDDFCLENQHMRACFSGMSGSLKSVHHVGDKEEQHLSSQFLVYGTRTTKDKSGAYLFLPDGEAKPYTPKDPPVVRVTEGPFFSEAAIYYQHIQEVVRLYNLPGVDGLSLEISCLVDIRDHVNRELALRFSSSIDSKGRFFTDLNGFQIQPRQYLKKLPLQANFYPMPVMAYIQDSQHRLTLHTAQALGVSSLSSGQLEVILDRRLMQDDNRGLGQGLKDNKRTCNRFRLLLERFSSANKRSSFFSKLASMLRDLVFPSSKVESPEAQENQPTSFPSLLSHITSMHLNAEVLTMPLVQEKLPPPALRSFAPFSTTVPCDFHLLNLRMLQGEDESLPSAETALILHRKGFDCGLEARNLGFNCTTTQGVLSLGSLFQSLNLISLQPSSLTLMYPLTTASHNSTTIHLDPMEIATFRLRLG
ncbi:alpha-mannosidase 2x isoform X4 [Ahaetulla prasina]|uniref:alpha-mannosidase 2x isoform X4 n=1 Tax=Ahaetulla prasina TaxID=499056 RepID=UPI002649EB8C|nr:alpha-mannosidase 2x isoform X4 [Ahaetulla prasina]